MKELKYGVKALRFLHILKERVLDIGYRTGLKRESKRGLPFEGEIFTEVN